MSLTKIGSIGINTGIQLAGVTTVSTLHVGSGVTLSSDGDGFFTGITSFTRNVTGDFAVRISNTHATGQGLNIRGGSANGQYALLVEDYAAANLFEINGDGEVEVKANHLRANHGVVVTGIVTATSFAGSGANLTGIDTDLVSDTSPQLGGNLDVNSKTINLGDSSGETVNRIRLGADNDGDLFHDGTDLFLRESDSGQILLRSDGAKVFANAAGSENQAIFRANGNVELYYDNSKKFETASGGVSVTGGINLTTNLSLLDNGYLKLGTGDDIELYHNASDSFLKNNTGNFEILTNEFRLRNNSGGETFMMASVNGEVQLWYDNAKKFETTDSGISAEGNTSTGNVIKGVTRFCPSGTTTVKVMYDETGFSNAGHFQVKDGVAFVVGDSSRGRFYYDSSANKTFLETASGGNLDIGSNHNADVQIKTNGTNRFNFGAGGFSPLADNTYTLGTSSLRWSNIYTADLHCSNKGSSNDVDGTWGDYTIQEGESDLFLINNRNGKKYKFNLTEVS